MSLRTGQMPTNPSPEREPQRSCPQLLGGEHKHTGLGGTQSQETTSKENK